jgi:hypothetical protein
MKAQMSVHSWRNGVKTLGVTVCLISTVFMWHGTGGGAQTTRLATILGIVGIGLVTTSRRI